MTMPGVGPVTAMRFSSALDDCRRFERAAQVAAYLGLTPGEDTTGFKTRRTGITKAGAPRVLLGLGESSTVER
jgi:transposase